MDISAILPVNMGNDSSSLNDDFSGQTASGDNIFSKAIGARTLFKTKTDGLVCVSFIFDPKHKFGDDHHMASVTSDWMADMRESLTKLIVDPKHIAPKVKSLEETIWDQMTSLLPKETLAKNLFSDKAQFEAYTQLLKSSVTKTYNEEDQLTKALESKAYSFSFEIAIDAYPQALGGNNEQKLDKTGVLTFHFEGLPDGKLPEPVIEPEKEEESNRKSKKRKTTETSDSTDKHKDAEKLLKEMAMTQFYKDAHVDKLKCFPLTATTFFEMINRWFSSVVSRRAAKLEKNRNRNPLYH